MRPLANHSLQEQDHGQIWLAPQRSGCRSSFLSLVTAHEISQLHQALAHGELPLDLETKLSKLAAGNLAERFIEQNCRLFITLFLAAQTGSFTQATSAARETLLRVLAYVRKDDDAIPDYQRGGFADDQREVREATLEFAALLAAFKAWRLQHQVPAMWAA